MPTTDAAMQACIDACKRCHDACLGTFTHHCLETGGDHIKPEHARLMLSCAEVCEACANVMCIGSGVHKYVCRACAEVCEACARDCERVGDMQDCVTACRACAESCRKMAA